MPRPQRHDVGYFPQWSPQKFTMMKIESYDFKEKLKALRNSSSSFIKRQDVKRAVFEKTNYKCALCGSKNDLQVDHIESVYKCARGKYPVEKINLLENLQALCSSCNARKKP